VGLVQHEIEKAGFTTISLSNMPAFTASTCVPRIAAIERPFGRVISEPGDRETQMGVLRAMLQAVETIRVPGEVIHLAYNYAGKKVTDADVTPPPIATYLKGHIRQVPRFVRRDIPQEFRV
jgi:hypothetical protein